MDAALRIAVVQLSPGEKSVVGLSVNVVGPPVTTALCRPEAVQLIVNQGSATVTGSLNVTVRFVAASTFVASAAGVVLTTDGAASAGVATPNEKT